MQRETGLAPMTGSKIRFNADFSGHAAYFSPRGNNLGNLYSAVGRDGTGLFDIYADQLTFAPIRLAISTFMVIIDRDRSKTGGSPLNGSNAGRRGAWDGMYWNTDFSLLTHSWERDAEGTRIESKKGQKWGPGMLIHVPYDLVSGRLGAGVTVVESVESAGTPDSYSLGHAYPNPFNPETTIEFAVPADEYVKMDVFNAVGQVVASLVDESLTAGTYKTTWDTRDQRGKPVSSGVYFYRMQAGDFAATRSMTPLK